MKYSVVTFGCRVNQSDSLGFEEQLLDEAPEFWCVAAGTVEEGTAFFGTIVQRRTK